MTDVVMPQMGESIVEGTLTKWLKKPGEHVERDEPLFEISTDKVDTEIPAPVAGTLAEVLVEEGKTVGINTVVGRINEAGGDGARPQSPAQQGPAAPPAAAVPPQRPAPSPPAQTSPPPPPAPAPNAHAAAQGQELGVRPGMGEPDFVSSPAPAPEAMQRAGESQGPLSPLVRRMARENNIDLNGVKGTGAGGRITKQDVEAYIAQQKGAPAAAQPRQPAPAVRPAAPAPQKAAQQAPQAPQTPVEAPPDSYTPPTRAQAKTRIEPMSTMRMKIAEHMVLSQRVSAHVTTVHKVDMTKVAKMRDRHRDDFQARYGISLTYLPFVARATVEALRTYPLLNASIEGNNIIYHNEINIGIAVALENGLIVPVIRNADEKNVLGLQRAIVDLAARARSRHLKPDEVQGGTFSITNFGSFGSVFATPVINQPQVAILGVGMVEKSPVVIDDAIGIRSISYLSLTFDHRLVDGALADQFTAKVKSVLENWSEEVL
ncbi:MAG: 2-oxoglutarate dehydrogenase, E2 component, dihydrolipoamide succinyltransferase [Acidobacteria bacterium]|nr:MAG: 2-oxoglutarate dehydrogenase, E2 component, dihydrolipoamide succinyltransferase [Acidobacteriota bacterium]